MLFDEGDHAGIAEFFDSLSEVGVYHPLISYSSGLAHVMSGNLVKGLSCFAKLAKQAVESQKAGGDSELSAFFCFALMQSALIAEFNSHHDIVVLSSFVEKVATIAKDMAELTGVADIFSGASDILSRIYYSPSGKPYIIPPSPQTLQIEPTNICNLKCIMCPRGRMKRREGIMGFDVWKEIFSGWSAKKTSLDFTHLVFRRKIRLSKSGSVKFFFLGESLLHPEFDEMILFAASEGSSVALQTNGTLLSRKGNAERLINSGVNEIGISLDGISEETYSGIRKGAAWETVRQGINLLLQKRDDSVSVRKPKIEISTIIASADTSVAYKVKQFLNDSFPGVDVIRFINLDCSYSPDFIDETGELRSHGKILQTSYSVEAPLCMEPFAKLNILWDGTVTPCCHDIDGNFALGSVKNQKIDEIWRGNTLERLLQALASHDLAFHPLCRTCRFPLV